jgi:hypothetical protein
METPLFLIEGADVMFFATTEDVENWVESYNADIGVLYDARGRVLRMTPREKRRVRVESGIEDRADPEALTESLREHAHYLVSKRPALTAQVGITTEWAREATLPELTAALAAYDEAWHNRPPTWLRKLIRRL